jgi:hypothetical protein
MEVPVAPERDEVGLELLDERRRTRAGVLGQSYASAP